MLCGQVSDKKIFTRAILRKKTTFFFVLKIFLVTPQSGIMRSQVTLGNVEIPAFVNMIECFAHFIKSKAKEIRTFTSNNNVFLTEMFSCE